MPGQGRLVQAGCFRPGQHAAGSRVPGGPTHRDPPCPWCWTGRRRCGGTCPHPGPGAGTRGARWRLRGTAGAGVSVTLATAAFLDPHSINWLKMCASQKRFPRAVHTRSTPGPPAPALTCADVVPVGVQGRQLLERASLGVVNPVGEGDLQQQRTAGCWSPALRPHMGRCAAWRSACIPRSPGSRPIPALLQAAALRCQQPSWRPGARGHDRPPACRPPQPPAAPAVLPLPPEPRTLSFFFRWAAKALMKASAGTSFTPLGPWTAVSSAMVLGCAKRVPAAQQPLLGPAALPGNRPANTGGPGNEL